MFSEKLIHIYKNRKANLIYINYVNYYPTKKKLKGRTSEITGIVYLVYKSFH